MSFLTDTNHWSKEQMETKHTRQLLAELRRTYFAWDYDWTDEDCAANAKYRQELKDVLATREHIPNKIESKNIRKARIKKGR